MANIDLKIRTKVYALSVRLFAAFGPVWEAGVVLPTVWNHFEGAFAVALRKEILVITETNVAADGITWSGGGQLILGAPRSAGPDWLDSSYAKPQIEAWIQAVKQVNDVFLAYSSKARATANDINKFPSSRGVSIRDWELHFVLARQFSRNL
jgi:hypothetical protein